MRNIDTIVYHYSATAEDWDIGLPEIRAMHQARGWSREGYHEIIRITGGIDHGRPWSMLGAGVKGQNTGALHICCIGGLRKGDDRGYDTRTQAQISSQIRLTEDMLRAFPHARVVGHSELASTQCPGYVGSSWWATRERGDGVPVDAPTVTRGYLKVGSSGREVLSLKEALKKLGYHGLPISSSYFGKYTEEQVLLFQEAAGLSVDGLVGPMTWAMIHQLGGN